MTSYHIDNLLIVTSATRYNLALLVTGFLLCAISIVLAIMLKRSHSNKDKLLAELQTTLQARQKNGEDQETQSVAEQSSNIFDDNLRMAELTSKLQRPRLTMQQSGYSPVAPERYRYIQSMVEKGMNAEEIASMLSMSLQETTQIVTLIKIVRQPQPYIGERLPAQETAGNRNSQAVTLTQPDREYVHRQTPTPQQSGTAHNSINRARLSAIWPSFPADLKKQAGSVDKKTDAIKQDIYASTEMPLGAQ